MVRGGWTKNLKRIREHEENGYKMFETGRKGEKRRKIEKKKASKKSKDQVPNLRKCLLSTTRACY